MASNIYMVMEEVRQVDTHPASTHRMVLEGLPRALERPPAGGQRHAYQDRFICMAREMLDDAQKLALDARATARSRVATIEEEMTNRKSSLDEAAQAEQAAQAEAEQKAAAMQEASGNVESAQQQHADFERVNMKTTTERTALQQSRQETASVSEGAYSRLAEQGAPDALGTTALEAVQVHLAEVCSDKALLAALPSALKVSPGDRKPFDRLTVDAGSNVLKRRLSALEEELAKGARESELAAAEALGFWAVADTSRDRAQEAKAEEKEAQSSLKIATSAHKRRLLEVDKQAQKLSTTVAEESAESARFGRLEAAGSALASLAAPADVADGDAA